MVVDKYLETVIYTGKSKTAQTTAVGTVLRESARVVNYIT